MGYVRTGLESSSIHVYLFTSTYVKKKCLLKQQIFPIPVILPPFLLFLFNCIFNDADFCLL